jgi:hypothetical protein
LIHGHFLSGVNPSLRVFSIRALLSNCLAIDLKWDCLPVKLNETTALTHGVGKFPQLLGNIPHRKNPSASLEPFTDVIDFVGLQVAEHDGTTGYVAKNG